MEAVKSLLKPKPTPQQQLREWQRRLRNEGRNIERQIRDVQREEKKVEKSIREAAKRNDIGSAKEQQCSTQDPLRILMRYSSHAFAENWLTLHCA
ncbi:hypothetical protein ABZP36_019294 [Zizania latifolia]